MKKELKILVVDDSRDQRTAARIQLKDHDITVAGSYDEGRELLQYRHRFEVVLVDLLLPASSLFIDMGTEGRPMSLVGQEMPVGIFLALLAAKNGAKYVAVFTDSDHHSHPASACFDAFNKGENQPIPLTVEGAKVLLCNNRSWVENIRDDKHQIVGRIKYWHKLLDYLISIG